MLIVSCWKTPDVFEIHFEKRRLFIMNIQKHISICLIILISYLMWISCTPKEPLSPQAEEETKTIRHEENINNYEVWESDKKHIVLTAISIDNAVLKIRPGTTVQFEQAASISVNDRAGFIADGSEQPIIFTSTLAERGAWNYIHFADGAKDDSCRLINCQIKYGGGDINLGAVIHCANASPTITGCTIDSNLSSGVTLIGDCRAIQFYDNTISNCEFMPVQAYAVNVASIGNNSYRDNGIDQINIIEGNVDFDATWLNPSVPYRVADGLKIKNAKLTISPMVKIVFEDHQGITISDGGSLYAAGTPSQPITFTRGWTGPWKGIYFTATANDAESKLVYCEIEHGGQDSNRPANIILEDASPEISSSVIRHSPGYGIYISGKLAPGRLDNNTITNNAIAPISIPANSVASLSPGSYAGNGSDVIEVRGAPLEQAIVNDGYWTDPGVPYRIQGTIQIQSGTLILAPGVPIQMAERSGFEIQVQGGLIADGTDKLITIEGVQPITGIWNHIFFSSFANERNCQLINCRISYGGGDLNRPGMIFCENISPIIRNCIIEYSQSYGIYLKGNTNILDLQSNIFNGNSSGNYYKAP
jgi:hypothetical protein